MNFVDGIEIGGIHAYPGSPFGVPYSRAEKVYDISAAGDGSVKLYLFSADNGYDAVVRGNGAIANYLYTEATSTNSHTDDRPYDAETITRLFIDCPCTAQRSGWYHIHWRLLYVQGIQSEGSDLC